MTCYVDDMLRPAHIGNGRPAKWSHLFADTPDELEAIAGRLGLSRQWIQHEGTHREHYDVTAAVRDNAIILSPLLATKRPAGGLLLLAGHRRLAACKLAKLTTAPTIVLGPKLADDQLTIAIVENLHRAQLSPMDEARACQALLDHGRSKKDIAVDLARSNGWVADRLALMELPRELQRKVDTGDLTIGQGAQLGHGLKKRGTASVVTNARAPFHFTHGHPLADRAIERCDAAKHPTLGRIGPACGACWEAEIRLAEATTLRGVA